MTITRIPFAIASDEEVSLAYSRQRLLNVYAERPQTSAKSPVLILGSPGLKPWASGLQSGVRGSDVMADILYAVSGYTLYSVDSSGTPTALGAVGGTGPVIMANNGTQLCIATDTAWVAETDGYMIWGRNGAGSAFLYTAGGSVAQIADPDLFLTGTGKFQLSALNDASTYSALDFATAEKLPDDLIRGFVDRFDLILFGSENTEVWFDSGAAGFPFDRRTIIPKGIMGPHCVAQLDNSVFWVGRDPKAGGGAIVYRLLGYEAQRISSHAAEYVFGLVTDWSRVKCISYVVNGHSFFQVILNDQASWIYDCATKLWHERDTLSLGRWQGSSQSYAYSKQIIGSSSNGKLFTLDPAYYFDDTATQVQRELISLPIGTDDTWKTMASFQLDMETGVGLAAGLGSNPQVMLSYSDDRGKTWCNEKWRSIGLSGNYGLRVIWRNLGSFRSRMIKLRFTDPVPIRLLDYFADIR